MSGVAFYGLADYFVDEPVELFRTREEAELFLDEVLADEPDWVGWLEIVPVNLPLCPN